MKENVKKVLLFVVMPFLAFIMLVSTGIVLLTNNNQNKIVKAAYNNFSATWQVFYWSNWQPSNGRYIHKVGNDYFYDFNYNHYKLDISTSYWTSFSWTGFQTVNALYVWSDGTNYYYSSGTTHYQLDYTNYTATAVTFNLSNFYGSQVWNFNGSIHLDYGSNHYVYNSLTNEWDTYTWSTNNIVSLWLDGSNIYYFDGVYYAFSTIVTRRYIYDNTNNYWTNLTWTDFPSDFDTACLYTISDYLLYTRNNVTYLVDTSDYSFSEFTFNYDNNLSGSIYTGIDVYVINDTAYYYSGQVGSFATTLRLVMSNSGSGADIPTDNFVGNNIIVPFSIYRDHILGSGLTEDDGIHFASFQVGFEIDENDEYIMTFNTSYMSNSTTEIPFSYYTVGNSNTHLTDITFTTSDIGNAFNVRAYDSTLYHDGSEQNFSYYRYMAMNVAISSGFTNFAFVGVHMYSSYTTETLSSNTYYSINNFIEYFDANNEYIRISISLYTTIGTSIDLFSDRLYYFSNAVSGSGSNYSSYLSGYNDGYDEGYSDGETDGYSTGSTSGYNNGYQAGYTAASGEVGQTQYQSGYQAGYTDGANDANTYSFTALIGSVIDTPIRYFSSLFNFNLLGVNLLTFMLALLTLGFVIIIIKHII